MKYLLVTPLLLLVASCSHSEASSASTGSNLSPSGQYLKKGDTRSFDVTYEAKIGEVPAGTKTLRVWLPVPVDSSVQTISNLKFDAPVEAAVAREPKYGNKVAYFEFENPKGVPAIKMMFTVERKEVLTDVDALQSEGSETEDLSVFLKPDKLVVIDDRVREWTKKATEGKSTTVEKARGIYDHVRAHMKYDKSGKGWGRGDTVYACEVGRGNCTDFHSLFNSMCRAAGIASGFEIGLYLPYDRDNKPPKLGGYHCWASFRVPGKTWVPVDISEASKMPDRAAYFFGNHTSNRVTLSTGRDIDLVPKQSGPALNYFLKPYAEADDKKVSCSKVWDYKERN
jgi:transglutaminase-like putative cysteine protease